MYKLIILPQAAHFLKKIKEKPLKSVFQKVIDDIIQNPYTGDPKTGDLSGVYCCDFFYNKTNYEIAYTILEKNGMTVIVILAGTRENFYVKLGLGKEVECFIEKNALVIRSLSKDDGAFSIEILKDLVSQGYSGTELVEKFTEESQNIKIVNTNS